MSPFLQRKLRAMSTALVIILSFVTAAVLAWMVRWYETGREPGPTACSRVLDEVFAGGAMNTDDAVLLARLLEHQDECIGDARYVEQARRLLLNTQQIDEARALLKEAGRRGTFTADELTGQVAWVDFAAARLAWSNGAESRAEALHADVMSAANDLRHKWPEWSVPYTILGEAGRATWAKSATAQTTDYYQLERTARRRVLNGAFVRAFTDWQPIAYVFVVTVTGMLGLCAGVSGLVAMREMTRMTTTPIAMAQPGYVELKGTLHASSNSAAVIGPHSKARGVWYEVESNSGFKGSRPTLERSAQSFVLRDASGEAVVEPKGMTVRTRHVAGTFGSGGGVTSSKRVSERMLKEDDAAYVLGELSVTTAPNGARVRQVRVAENGRRLIVSNLSEEQLLFRERLWFWIGTFVFAMTVLMLSWSYYQRYYVSAAPGALQ